LDCVVIARFWKRGFGSMPTFYGQSLATRHRRLSRDQLRSDVAAVSWLAHAIGLAVESQDESLPDHPA
jgi:hypothetical protein